MDYQVGQEFIIIQRAKQKRFHQATMFYIKRISATTVEVRTNQKTDCSVPKFYFDALIQSKQVVNKPPYVATI